MSFLSLCRYARKKVPAPSPGGRQSAKYYMRCKHTQCPARKTVRVFVPGFDYTVQCVQEHSHCVGQEPPLLPPGTALPGCRKPKCKEGTAPKKINARACFDEACKENLGHTHLASDKSQAHADVLCQVLAAQLAVLQQQPVRSSSNGATGRHKELLLNMLAVRDRRPN